MNGTEKQKQNSPVAQEEKSATKGLTHIDLKGSFSFGIQQLGRIPFLANLCIPMLQ